MSNIPEDIMQAANEVWDAIPLLYRASAVEAIAKAILAERQRDQWQPIDTAPNKGLFLAGNGRHGVSIATVGWHFGEKRFYDTEALENANYIRVHPTHWMPLPSAPNGGEA